MLIAYSLMAVLVVGIIALKIGEHFGYEKGYANGGKDMSHKIWNEIVDENHLCEDDYL